MVLGLGKGAQLEFWIYPGTGIMNCGEWSWSKRVLYECMHSLQRCLVRSNEVLPQYEKKGFINLNT